MIDRHEFVLTVLLLFSGLEIGNSKSSDVQTTVTNHEKYTQLNLNEEHSLELLQKWMEQALAGLMGALATVKLEEVHEDDKEEHAQCAKNATSVIEHAKCTVQLIDKGKRVPSSTRNWTKSEMAMKHSSFTLPTISVGDSSSKKEQKWNSLKPQKNRKMLKHEQQKVLPSDVSWVGSFGVREKRSFDLSAFLMNSPKEKRRDTALKWRKVHRRRIGSPWTTTTTGPKIRKTSKYELRDAKRDTPFGQLARAIKKSVLEAKHKNAEQSKDWITVIKEVKEETAKLRARKMIRKMFNKKIASMQEGYGNKTAVNQRRPLAMKDLDDLDEMSPKEMVDVAHRIEASLTSEEKIMREPMKLLRNVVKMGLMAAGQNVSDFAEKTLKLISPRLLPVMADEENAEDDQVSLLSPSLFALHNEGKGIEKATSLVDGMGLAKTTEHMAWLDLVMEASGVTDAVEYLKDEKIKKTMKGVMGEDEMRSPTGQPLYFTKENVTEIFGEPETKKIDTFEKLQSMYTPDQVEDQKKQGFSILTKDQLEVVYGKDSPYANEERLETLKSIPKEKMHGHILNNIRALAEMKSLRVGNVIEPGRSRRKRNVILAPVILIPLIFASPLVSGPIILSPLTLSTSLLSPAVLGPVILSPWTFFPVILSPRALSPLIVNPLIFAPVILSPLVLHPFILAPGVFNPFILSPFALSPFILSPQVFTPIILSPFVLSPIILTPTVGGPLILSPFALSPIIASPQIMFAAVLSPFVLSPLPWSPLIFAEVVASPSALS
ncbi:hypothetical protein PMAYCL1PPCAC_15312 [Pristionchus mayeri]|uniref:Uncharacterized protein n=1 Tax=Pristionchus mayeri TaxID=1317129 RepID=A0AAN5HXV3_9BILA|nr:hypothetical protein PMAYCL1PPCAC_15312 [Pristionchus mayeri]